MILNQIIQDLVLFFICGPLKIKKAIPWRNGFIGWSNNYRLLLYI